MLTKAKLDKFIKVRNASPFNSNLQFSIDANACGFDVEELGDCIKVGEDHYRWNTGVGSYVLDEYFGKLGLIVDYPPIPLEECVVSDDRPFPELLDSAEHKALLTMAEHLWEDLQANNLGGFSGINRPFYILNEFKRVIEEFGNRDVGLNWSKDKLDNHPDNSLHKDAGK